MSQGKLLKSDGTLTAKARRDMLARLKPFGFLQFEAYILKRTGKSIKSMAIELQMSEEDFGSYHNAFLAGKGITPLKP